MKLISSIAKHRKPRQKVVSKDYYSRIDNWAIDLFFFAGMIIDSCATVAKWIWKLRFIATIAAIPTVGIGEGGTEGES